MASRRIAPELLDYSTWPTVADNVLVSGERRRFKRLKRAVEAACDGKKPSFILKKFGITRSHLQYLLERCTARHPDGRVCGYRALQLGFRLEQYERSADIAPHDDGHGMAGALEKLLREREGVRHWLHGQLSPLVETGSTLKEAGLRMTSIHAGFIEELRKDGVKPNEWPICTERMGYVSLTAYVNRLIEKGNNELAARKYGEHANDRLSTGSRRTGVVREIYSYDRCAYDEYKLPNICTLVIETDDGEIDIPLSRAYFCPTVDFRSGAVLGFSIAVSLRFRSMDLLQSVENSICPPESPRSDIFKDLQELPNEGFPARVVPQARGRRICHLMVDNHLTHLSELVLGHLRHRIGVPISFGKVRHWISRWVVEGLFAKLQRSLGRIASTTGSGPEDSAVTDPVGNAVRFRIRLDYLIALIEVLVARHNAQPCRRLMARSPNEVIASDCAEQRRLQIVPLYEDEFLRNAAIAVEVDYPTVRGSRRNGDPPYVQIDEVKYTNDILSQSWGLIGTQLMVYIGKDMRTLKAYLTNGSEFGVLTAIGKWGKSPHSREVRKEINRLIRQGKLQEHQDDPVTHWHKYLATEALLKAKTKRPKISREASQLARSLASQEPQPGTSRFHYRLESEPVNAPAAPAVHSRNRRHFFTPGDDQ